MGADFGPTVNSEMDVDSSIWDLVHEGMRKVISVSNATIFPESWPVELSGKTGTAEEDHTRANHGLFMGSLTMRAETILLLPSAFRLDILL